jgi:hypothetical protein
MIELSGVRNSCATEEKNIDLTLYEVDSSSLIFEISLMKAITYCLLLINEALT